MAILIAGSAGAQVRPGRTVEWRAEAVISDGVEAAGGIGVAQPIGTYLRLAALASAGVRMHDDRTIPLGRADVIARFLLDPFREARKGLSLGAGAGMILGDGSPRTVLVVLMELEGLRRPSGWVPAVQVGLGGGVRVAAVWRAGSQRWR